MVIIILSQYLAFILRILTAFPIFMEEPKMIPLSVNLTIGIVRKKLDEIIFHCCIVFDDFHAQNENQERCHRSNAGISC